MLYCTLIDVSLGWDLVMINLTYMIVYCCPCHWSSDVKSLDCVFPTDNLVLVIEVDALDITAEVTT